MRWPAIIALTMQSRMYHIRVVKAQVEVAKARAEVPAEKRLRPVGGPKPVVHLRSRGPVITSCPPADPRIAFCVPGSPTTCIRWPRQRPAVDRFGGGRRMVARPRTASEACIDRQVVASPSTSRHAVRLHEDSPSHAACARLAMLGGGRVAGQSPTAAAGTKHDYWREPKRTANAGKTTQFIQNGTLSQNLIQNEDLGAYTPLGTFSVPGGFHPRSAELARGGSQKSRGTMFAMMRRILPRCRGVTSLHASAITRRPLASRSCPQMR
jgi:hypothetical protein